MTVVADGHPYANGQLTTSATAEPLAVQTSPLEKGEEDSPKQPQRRSASSAAFRNSNEESRASLHSTGHSTTSSSPGESTMAVGQGPIYDRQPPPPPHPHQQQLLQPPSVAPMYAAATRVEKQALRSRSASLLFLNGGGNGGLGIHSQPSSPSSSLCSAIWVTKLVDSILYQTALQQESAATAASGPLTVAEVTVSFLAARYGRQQCRTTLHRFARCLQRYHHLSPACGIFRSYFFSQEASAVEQFRVLCSLYVSGDVAHGTEVQSRRVPLNVPGSGKCAGMQCCTTVPRRYMSRREIPHRLHRILTCALLTEEGPRTVRWAAAPTTAVVAVGGGGRLVSCLECSVVQQQRWRRRLEAVEVVAVKRIVLGWIAAGAQGQGPVRDLCNLAFDEVGKVDAHVLLQACVEAIMLVCCSSSAAPADTSIPRVMKKEDTGDVNHSPQQVSDPQKGCDGDAATVAADHWSCRTAGHFHIPLGRHDPAPCDASSAATVGPTGRRCSPEATEQSLEWQPHRTASIPSPHRHGSNTVNQNDDEHAAAITSTPRTPPQQTSRFSAHLSPTRTPHTPIPFVSALYGAERWERVKAEVAAAAAAAATMASHASSGAAAMVRRQTPLLSPYISRRTRSAPPAATAQVQVRRVVAGTSQRETTNSQRYRQQHRQAVMSAVGSPGALTAAEQGMLNELDAALRNLEVMYNAALKQ